MRRKVSGRFVMVKGFTLDFRSWDDEGRILVSTHDVVAARSLGMSLSNNGYYKGWVSRSKIEKSYYVTATGEINGVRVVIQEESDTEYLIYSSREVASIAQYERRERNVWEARVPKGAVTNTHKECKEVPLP